jgi:hypothetical protein
MHARRFISCTTLVLAAACAGHRADPNPPPSDYDLVLEVDNHNWADVLIYILHDGRQTRFLQVTGAKSVSQPVPSQLVSANGTIRLLVHRIGGLDDYLSPPVSVRNGGTIALTLEGQLHMSTVGVW